MFETLKRWFKKEDKVVKVELSAEHMASLEMSLLKNSRGDNIYYKYYYKEN